MAQPRPFLLLLASLAAAAAADDVDVLAELPKCPTWETGTPVPIEHSNGACDKSSDNNPARYTANWKVITGLATTGALLKVKDERTWICPEDEAVTDEMAAGIVAEGHRIKWVVRNRSSNPVSIALVDPSRNNIEVSAVNPKTAPAHSDPQAVLPPGQWKSVDVTLGTLLHVRELLRVGDAVAPGRVLVRHRPGLVPIKDRSFEPVDAPVLPDVGNIEEAPEAIEAKEAQRPQFSYDRMCNSLSRIFVNRAGSPVDVYWAGASDLDSSSGAAQHGKECQTRFAFHLGDDMTPAPNFVTTARDTIMSEENTYLGHRFVARLTADPSRIVDEVVMDRTDVMDCPGERKAKASATARQDIGVEVGGKVDEGEDDIKSNILAAFDAVGANLTALLLTGSN